MHCIKKIMIAFTAIYCSHNFAQETFLPDDVCQLIVIYVLIKQPTDAGNLAFTSRKLYTLITEKPNIIKTAVAERKDKAFSHYETAFMMRIPAITKPYVDANRNLLYNTLMLTLYEKEILKTPYADINFEGAESKLKIVCSDRPEKKLHWITWLIDHGAHDNNAHPKSMTALSTIIERSVAKKKAKKSLHTIAEMLVTKAGSDPSKHIHAAIDARDPDIIQLLITHGATIKEHDYEWLHDYLKKGNIDEDAIKFLLDQGYDPQKQAAERSRGRCLFLLGNAIETVARLEPSSKRDRILNLMQQYPKKGPAGADSN